MSDEGAEYTPSGPPIEDPDEILLRQIHPTMLRNDVPMSQAFKTMPKDQGMLSVSQGSRVDPKESWLRHTLVKGLQSGGVWGFSAQESGRPCFSDPTENPPDDAHALVSFRGLSRGQIDAVAKNLQRAAEQRGCLHKP